MTLEHKLDSAGRYETTYNSATDEVTLWDTEKGIKVRSEVIDMTLLEAIALLESEQGEIGPISAEETMLLLNYGALIEHHREFAAHDLARFGEVGVSG